MNDKNKISYDISKVIRTVQEAEDFNLEVDKILESFYKLKNKNLDEIISSAAGNKTSGIIKKILSDNKVLPTDYSSCEKLLNQLREEIRKMKVVKITLAINPSDEMISRISSWINENFEKNNLIEVTIDEKIIGGAIISADGKYKDFSLKKSLSDILIKSEAEIISKISSR